MFGKNKSCEELAIEPKDGNKHVLLIHTQLSGRNKPEKIYNEEINEIIKMMQNKGYEIIDMKLGEHTGIYYETLIIYK